MKKLLVMLLIVIGVANGMLAMDNSNNNELHEIKRRIMEFNAPDFSAEAQKKYDHALRGFQYVPLQLLDVSYITELKELNESKKKVQERFGQDILSAPADDLDVQNMMQLYRGLIGIYYEQEREKADYERNSNEFNKPENRKKYSKVFRRKKLAEMSSGDLERAILKDKMNRE